MARMKLSGVPSSGLTNTMSFGSRRGVSIARKTTGSSRIFGCSMLLGGGAAAGGPIAVQETGEIRSLREQLAKAPRRRGFKTVPMILDTPNLWDAEALDAIITYRGSRKQVWTTPRSTARG
jgi:hypothetical protein